MRLLGFFLAFYRRCASPVLHFLFGAGGGCRFYPSCSDYCEQAVRSYGLLKGLGFSMTRLLRCHPYSKGGFDPVPERIKRTVLRDAGMNKSC